MIPFFRIERTATAARGQHINKLISAYNEDDQSAPDLTAPVQEQTVNYYNHDHRSLCVYLFLFLFTFYFYIVCWYIFSSILFYCFNNQKKYMMKMMMKTITYTIHKETDTID